MGSTGIGVDDPDLDRVGGQERMDTNQYNRQPQKEYKKQPLLRISSPFSNTDTPASEPPPTRGCDLIIAWPGNNSKKGIKENSSRPNELFVRHSLKKKFFHAINR